MLGLHDRLQQGRNILDRDLLAAEQTAYAPLDEPESELDTGQRVLEFVPGHAQEGLHSGGRFAQGLFLRSVQPLIVRRREALAHQREQQETQGNQGRRCAMDGARSQFGLDEQRGAHEHGSGNGSRRPQTGNQVLRSQGVGLRLWGCGLSGLARSPAKLTAACWNCTRPASGTSRIKASQNRLGGLPSW